MFLCHHPNKQTNKQTKKKKGFGTNNAPYGCGNPMAGVASSYTEPFAVGAWVTHRFTLSTTGVNRLYENGVLIVTWSDVGTTSGVVSFGVSCRNFHVEYLKVLEYEVPNGLTPIDFPVFFGPAW